MKYYGIYFSLLICCNVFAQKNNINRKDSLKILNPRYFYSELKVEKDHTLSAVSLPCDSVRFVDVRYDTTFIALNWKSSFSKGTYKNKFDVAGGLENGFAKYFNTYYKCSDNTGVQLVCFVKKFSVTWKQDLLDHFMQNMDFEQTINNNINVQIDCYYQKYNLMYPATRIDTTFKGDFLVRQTKFEEAVKMMLQPFQDKIEHLNIASILQRKAYTTQQIDDRYSARFQIPVLNAIEYKKGLYTSFADFRNNKPSLDSFLMSTDKMKYSSSFSDYLGTLRMISKATEKRNTAIFFYTPDKELIPPSTVFAYCDGTTFWIQHGALYYPLVKVGNTFEFIYTYYFTGIDIITGNDHLTQSAHILLPLNMETGSSN